MKGKNAKSMGQPVYAGLELDIFGKLAHEKSEKLKAQKLKEEEKAAQKPESSNSKAGKL